MAGRGSKAGPRVRARGAMLTAAAALTALSGVLVVCAPPAGARSPAGGIVLDDAVNCVVEMARPGVAMKVRRAASWPPIDARSLASWRDAHPVCWLVVWVAMVAAPCLC